jgi:hypothetical protein
MPSDRWTENAKVHAVALHRPTTDGKDVTVPVVTIYRTNDEDVISDYRVYIDLAPVFAED